MKVGVLTLGAYGDIINAIPIALFQHAQGNRVTFICSRPYAPIFDGISYCDCTAWNGEYSQPLPAFEAHRANFDQLLLAQCYGTQHGYLCESFCQEAWRLVGMLEHWDKITLVFDRRSADRETDLLAKIGNREKPKVLVSTAGRSSPFPHREALTALLEPLKDQFDFIDLDGFKGERIFDLLGLYDRAAFLIATDSAPLHLSFATPDLPVIALITDSPTYWHGAPARPNQLLRIRYAEFNQRKNEIIDALKGVAKPRRIIHVYSDYERKDAGSAKRHAIAKASWKREYDRGGWFPLPVRFSESHRNSTSVGERKSVPFVRDIFAAALDTAGDEDIVFFTNDDVVFLPGITEQVLRVVPMRGAAWGARREMQRINGPPTLAQALKGYQHCGADIFAFTKKWWAKYGAEFPDCLLSFEMFDLMLKKIMDYSGGGVLKDACCHEIHQSYWHNPNNRECVGNLHNRELGRRWIASRNIKWEEVFK